MWLIKVKTWGYTSKVFGEIEFEMEVNTDEELVAMMNNLNKSLKHDVTFVVSREEKDVESEGQM